MNAIKAYFKQQRDWRQAKRWLNGHSNPAQFAASLMFRLNRHIRRKNRTPQKRTIYRLKNLFVHHLYEAGYCNRVTEQYQKQECWSCYKGEHWTGDMCWKCDGNGVYSETYLYQFRFNVDGETYIWHQPESLVWWNVEPTDPDAEVTDYKPGNNDRLYLNADIQNLYILAVYEYLLRQGVPEYQPPEHIQTEYGYFVSRETNTLPRLKILKGSIRADIYSFWFPKKRRVKWWWSRNFDERIENIKRLVSFVKTGEMPPKSYELSEDEIPF